jgi:D-serine deaminase-like pyridoxal phosphate-dependent protein
MDSRIGLRKDELDTPTLLVDLDILDRNISEIAETCRAHHVNWRPHAKSHKSPDIVRRQLVAGAKGIVCAKLAEAEVMAQAGIDDIMIANQIVGDIKVERLAGLSRYAETIVAVDSIENVIALAARFRVSDRPLSAVIEVDIGMGRAGVSPGEQVAELAAAIAAARGLRFRGVMGWESHVVSIPDPILKANAVKEAIGLLVTSAELCRKKGLPVDIVSCGGTGVFPYCCAEPGVTEVQVGGGIFSDIHYRTHADFRFPYALTLLAIVTSRPTTTRVILDVGRKELSADLAMPEPLGVPEVASIRLSAEHTTIELKRPSVEPKVGDHVEMIAGYSDTTIHLHEDIVGLRKGVVETVWPISGRGKFK